MNYDIHPGSFRGEEALFAPPEREFQQASVSIVAERHAECMILGRVPFDSIIANRADWISFIIHTRNLVALGKVSPGELGIAGMPEDIVKSWTQAYSAGSFATSEELGVSATYLCNMFLPEAEQCLSTEVGSLNFHELSTHFWGTESSPGFRGSQDQICPRDGQRGSSIVDVLEEHAARATHFLSWCWAYSVDMVTTSLASYAIRSQAQVCLWVCFFCNNQRKLLIQGICDNDCLDTVFSERLKSIGNIILLLNDYTHPTYVTRIWCVFETYTAIVGELSMSVVIPPEMHSKLETSLLKGKLQDIAQQLSVIHVEQAKASHIEDEEHIKRIIQTSVGFEQVNTVVKSALMQWLSDAFHDLLGQHKTGRVSQTLFSLLDAESKGFFTMKDLHNFKADYALLFSYISSTADVEDAFDCMDRAMKGNVRLEQFSDYLFRKKLHSADAFSNFLCQTDFADLKSAEIAYLRSEEVRLEDEIAQAGSQLASCRSLIKKLSGGVLAV
eukprot:TRINITY_DN76091_c0_g1_i1.p1 TRINITY_DN76091_c0_g1~~TRINITY_DN76091_c0_g1_i1.p1  ORF type:complete len:500 (-),score=66.42 TRINITY_DN76091_c0_g1_i1:17-1516(-)